MYQGGLQNENQEEDSKPPGIFSLVQAQVNLNQSPQGILKFKWIGISTGQVEATVEIYNDFLFARTKSQLFCLNFQIGVYFDYDLADGILQFHNKESGRMDRFQSVDLKQFPYFLQKIKQKCPQQNFQSKYVFIQEKSKTKKSSVFKVRRKSDSIILAVKTLLYSTKVQNELSIMKELHHPNLVYLHQYFIQSDSTVYLVMDYEDGGNLFHIISDKSELQYKEKLKIVIDMMNALQYLRIKGIVHRDIKPENILYSVKQRLYKIGDFGLATRVGEKKVKACGTPGYIAPELLLEQTSDQANDVKSDVYSLGLTLYQLFTKKQYYHGITVDEILQKNRKTQSFKIKNFQSSDPYKFQGKLLQKMIRKKPEQRENSLQIMQSSLYRKISLQYGKQMSNNSSVKSVSSSSDDERFMETVKKLFKLKTSSP